MTEQPGAGLPGPWTAILDDVWTLDTAGAEAAGLDEQVAAPRVA